VVLAIARSYSLTLPLQPTIPAIKANVIKKTLNLAM
jgi:hypothetical protein